MRGRFVDLSAIALLLAAPLQLFGKGDTVGITITGADLAAPIEITDPAVARFRVWSGPGTSSNEPQGLNVDWARGIVEPPKGLQVYEVSFVTTRGNPGTYVVRYALDPSTNQGYVYIPGNTDSGYRDNVWLIYRGIEGHWFHAWSEWEKLANPLIAKSRTTHRG